MTAGVRATSGEFAPSRLGALPSGVMPLRSELDDTNRRAGSATWTFEATLADAIGLERPRRAIDAARGTVKPREAIRLSLSKLERAMLR